MAGNPGDDDRAVAAACTDDWLGRVVEHEADGTREILDDFAAFATAEPGATNHLSSLLHWLTVTPDRDFVAATGTYLEHLLEAGETGPERLDARLRTVGLARREAQRLAAADCGGSAPKP